MRKFETTVFRKPSNSNEIINIKCKTPYNYRIAGIRSYVNRAINICSNNKLLKEEIDFIKEISKQAGYNENIIDRIYKERIEKLDIINPAQKTNKIFTNAFPYCRGISNFIKRKTAEHNIFLPIKPNKNIFQRIRSDKDNIEPKETAGIYRINYENLEGKGGCYIGMTKRKISERIKEHKRDCRLLNESAALSELNKNEEVIIHFNEAAKIAQYNTDKYAKNREAIEIILNSDCCNKVEHAKIDTRWRHLLTSRGKISAERVSSGSGEGPAMKNGQSTSND